MSLLPATTYVAPPRSGRGRPLKTIVEAEECTFGLRSDTSGDESDRTIIARPSGLDTKLATAATAATARSKLSSSSYTTAPSPVAESPCSSIDEGSVQGLNRSSYAGSDAGTVFSEDSCPSLAGSQDTTFYTNSSRHSMSSTQSVKSNRNRYPSILIPRDSWQDESGIKEITLGMSPAQKILLSPQALSALPRDVPSLNAPPSFGDGSSMASNSPCIPAISSAPITPDLHNLAPAQGQSWGEMNEQPKSPLQEVVEQRHSVALSYNDARSQSDRTSVGYSTDWSDLVVRFPEIPGATPQENTPISPNMELLKRFKSQASDHGVQLPMDALDLLQNITRSYSPVSESRQSGTSRGAQVEMKERSVTGDRPKSVAGETPTSDYSFSQLSIPSPGGFFSSLQANSRSTWCLPSQQRDSSVPSSAIAADFYNVPFSRTSVTFETILEVPDGAVTDGPPTARQPEFEIPAEYRADEAEEEDDDLYGAQYYAVKPTVQSSSPGLSHEYEAQYESGLKQAAVANIDRTSDWLSAQTTYLSALRETNPRNDPSNYIPQTPFPQEENEQIDESPARKAVRFLEETIGISKAVSDETKKTTREPKPKDPVFLEAFNHCLVQKGSQDAFLQAAARLESINANRLALPVQHVHSLLNTHTTETLQMNVRPRYRGPFSQNPRATGNFQRTAEQVVFAEAERRQLAMSHVLPTVWATEALRKVLYRGGLFACPSVAKYLSKKSTTTNKPVRVLDLAGAATGSWAWTAAQAFPNVSFVTVQAKVQSQPASQWPSLGTDKPKVVKPTNPENHRVITVPELWKLPFADNHFDVISARTLYMFLRSRPVPAMPNINEWDLVLKECMRVLKAGGIFDYVLLDSHIANNNTDNRSGHSRDNSNEASISPTAAYGQALMSPPHTSTFGPSASLLNPASFSFGRDLKRRGYEADGGCAQVAERLQASGFTSLKSQQLGLPLGRTGSTHDNVAASYEKFEARAPTPATVASKSTATGLQRSKIGSISQANGRSRTPFPPAPRPISEVSTISRIIEQYSNVEAVQGPVGSTADVSDLAGLLGTVMWEEWLVRHRLEVLNSRTHQTTEDKESVDPTFNATNLLHGINDILASGYEKGGCFRVVVGWAKKPAKNPVVKKTQMQETSRVQPSLDTYRARAAQRALLNSQYEGFPSEQTPLTANTATTITPRANQYYGRGFMTPVEYRRHELQLDTRSPLTGTHWSPQYTQSAVDRGEVGTIPVMIVE